MVNNDEYNMDVGINNSNDNVDGDNDNDEDNDADDDDNGDEKEEEDDDDDDDDGEYDDDDDDDDDNNDDVSTSSLEILLQQQTALIETLQTRLTAAENKLNDVEGRVRAHDGLYAFFLSQVSVTPATYSHLHIVKEESTLELVHSEADDMERDDQCSGQVTTHLAEGQRVWVKREHGEAVTGACVSSLETLVQQQAVVIQTLQTKLNALENNVHANSHDIASLKLKHPKPAPVGGVYSFFLTEMSASTASQHGLYLAIVKEGAVLDYVYAEGSDSSEEGSSQVTTHLAAGQQTLVQQQAALIQTMQADLTAAKHRLSTLEHGFHTHDTKISAIQQKQAQAATHSTLIFDKIVYNLGNGYSTRTGIFTAPVSGVYSFFLNAMSVTSHHALRLQIAREGSTLDTVYAEGGNDVNDQGSSEVTTHLKAGQQTLVQQQAALIQTMQADLTAAKHRLEYSGTWLPHHDTKISGIQQKQAQAAAFSVRFANDDSSHGIPLTAHSTLKFDKIIYNLGNGYDTRTGIFTAPVTGVYAFFLNAMSVNSHHALKLQIMKETTWLDIAYAEGGTDANDQGSTEVTTHLKAGQQSG
nr:hypothetical protein BaRGS_033323 [Batillaria attramentaria]